MAVDIGPKIGIDGESKFRQQITSINNSIKVLGSEMKIVTAEFGKNAKSEEALTKKNEILERKTIELREKLELQTKALIDTGREMGADAEETKKLQIAVNNTTAELAKAEREIKENEAALNDLGNEVEDTGEEFDGAGQKAISFGDVLKANVLGQAIMDGLHALANGVKKVGKAMFDAVKDGAAFGDEMLTLADKTGLSTDTLQEFEYMSGLIDVDLDTITGSMSKLIKNMSAASKGTGEAATAFEALGINITDANGELRNNQDVFYEIVDALGGVANETQRDAYAMAIFGKSAQDLNPLIKAGSDQISAFAQEAHDLGYVLDKDALGSLQETQNAFDRFDNVVKGIKNNLAQALAPTIEELSARFKEWAASVDWGAVGQKIGAFVDKMREFGSFMSENGSTIISIIAGIGTALLTLNVAKMITGLVTAIKTFQAANEGATIAQALLNTTMLANPAVLITAGIVALAAAIGTLLLTNEDFRNKVKAIWEDIKNFFAKAWESITGFFKNAWETIKTIWNNSIIGQYYKNIWETIKAVFSVVKDVLTGNWRDAWEGITGIVDTWANYFEDVWAKIKNVFSDVGTAFLNVGKAIIDGVWNGIKNAADIFTTNVKNFFKGIVDSVKKVLGIKSPSKVFAGIGKNMVAGMEQGWDSEFSNVQRSIDDSINSLSPTASVAVNASASTSGGDITGAVRLALSGAAVYLDGNKVGKIIFTRQNNETIARGMSPVYA